MKRVVFLSNHVHCFYWPESGSVSSPNTTDFATCLQNLMTSWPTLSLKTEAAHSSRMLASLYDTAWHYNPEDFNLKLSTTHTNSLTYLRKFRTIWYEYENLRTNGTLNKLSWSIRSKWVNWSCTGVKMRHSYSPIIMYCISKK
jgi:hypothetical protein